MKKKFKLEHDQEETEHFLDGEPARDLNSIILPLSKIIIEDNIRKEITGIEELADSIRTNGLINPITVANRGKGFVLVAGERRFRALQLLGETHVSSRITNVSPEQLKVIQLLENLDRESLTGIEEIIAVAELLPLYKNNQTALARAISRSKSYVSNCCRSLTVIRSLLTDVSTSKHLSKSIFFELANSKDPKKMWDKINGQKLTVKDIRIVGESNSDSNKPDEGHKTPKNPSNKSIIQFKSDHSKQNFSLKIQYYEQTISNSDKQKLVELLEELLSKIR